MNMRAYTDYAVVNNADDQIVGILRKFRVSRTPLVFNNAKLAVIEDKGFIKETLSVRLSTSKEYLDQYRKFNVPFVDVKVCLSASKTIPADYLISDYSLELVRSLLTNKD